MKHSEAQAKLSSPFVYVGVPAGYVFLVHHYKTELNGEVIYGTHEEIANLAAYLLPADPVEAPVATV